MADPLSILSGLSASGQILSIVVKTIIAISKFCEDFRNAPRHFLRIRDRFGEIEAILIEIETQTQTLTEDDLVPSNTRILLTGAIATVLKEVIEVQKHLPRQTYVAGKLQWAVFRKRISAKSLEELDQAEASLLKIIQFLT